MLQLASIVILGIVAQWVAWRVRMPAILPLIIIGLLIGPIASLDQLFGEKLLDPEELFDNKVLGYFVSLSVGLILFEGGLTLKLKEVRHVASTVRNLVIIAPFISLIGGGLAAHYILGLDIEIAMLFGALIIVTGPTVIGPILRNVHPNKNVATVLKWESIIIDPVGAVFAVLVYEFILSGAGASFTGQALLTFGKTIFAGLLMGILGAALLYQMLKRRLVPDYLVNVVSLAVVFASFIAADLLAPESGLLATAAMGIILANLRLPEIVGILNFKESLTVLLISILFIVLSANINMAQLELLGVNSLIVLGVVIFILRPISVAICAWGSNLNWRERTFIAWIGPRGIVAAAIASIFSITLMGSDRISVEQQEAAALLLPLTFLVILGTVIIQGISAKGVAVLLGVRRKDPQGFLILGANEPARHLASYLQMLRKQVTMVDTSRTAVHEAKQVGLRVLEQNILSDLVTDELEVLDVGTFLAMTSNNELNIFAGRKFRKEIGADNTYRLITRHEVQYTSLVRPKHILFSDHADFYALVDIVRKYPHVKEIKPDSAEELMQIMAGDTNEFVPVLMRSPEGVVRIIRAGEAVTYQLGDTLAYFGKPLITA